MFSTSVSQCNCGTMYYKAFQLSCGIVDMLYQEYDLQWQCREGLTGGQLLLLTWVMSIPTLVHNYHHKLYTHQDLCRHGGSKTPLGTISAI